MKKILVSSLLVIAVVLASSMMSYSAQAVRLDLAFSDAPESLPGQTASAFQEKVDELSNGEIEVVLYPSEQFGSGREMMENLEGGILDMGMLASPVPALIPELNVVDLPFIFQDREHVTNAFEGEFGEWVSDILYESASIHLLAANEHGFRHITNNTRPINSASDLEGLTIRTPDNPLRLETFDAFGADATPMDFGELYMALQQGVVDGQENPIVQIYASSFYEVQDYMSLTNHVYSPNYHLISDAAWNRLTDDQREIVQEAADYANKVNYEVAVGEEEEMLEEMSEYMEINEVEDMESFLSIVEEIYEEYEDQWAEEIEMIQNAAE